MLDEDYLQIEVTTYQVVGSFQGEDVCGTHLPWAGWSWHQSEGCCSILGLELGAVSHCQTASSMALFMPSQKTHP